MLVIWAVDTNVLLEHAASNFRDEGLRSDKYDLKLSIEQGKLFLIYSCGRIVSNVAAQCVKTLT